MPMVQIKIFKSKIKSLAIEKIICSYKFLSDVQKIIHELEKGNLITERCGSEPILNSQILLF